jgi:phosphoribosylaminoimidazole-succinocarboxamide synthase
VFHPDPLPSAPPDLLQASSLPGIHLLARGKVRDVYDVDGQVVLVATDRVSAFDVVMPNPIPYKGYVLTQLSAFWFDLLKDAQANHVVTTQVSAFPSVLAPFAGLLAGRSMLCRKAERIDIECVARGYLTGSAWDEYKAHGTIHGAPMPAGWQENQQLDPPLFTPTTKAASGHDVPLSHEQFVQRAGESLAGRLAATTVRLYQQASEYAATRGILIADTKLEFGLIDGTLTWIDEAFTPDSSRFWAAEDYRLGATIPSLDKQFLRNYLIELGWRREPPAPDLPVGVVEQTSKRYLDIFTRLTGVHGPAAV